MNDGHIYDGARISGCTIRLVKLKCNRCDTVVYCDESFFVFFGNDRKPMFGISFHGVCQACGSRASILLPLPLDDKIAAELVNEKEAICFSREDAKFLRDLGIVGKP